MEPVARALEQLSLWSGCRVIVIGDALLDGWLTGRPRNLCREAPVPVLSLHQEDYEAGGAANTAANLAALGAEVTLVAAVGRDTDADRLRGCLDLAGVQPRLVEVIGWRTPAKRRLIADEQIMARIDDTDHQPLPEEAMRHLCLQVADEIGDVDAVLVGDYGLGVADERMAAWLAQRRNRLPLLAVDSHDVSRWAVTRPDLMTPSFSEVAPLLEPPETTGRAATIEEQQDSLLQRLQARVLAVTLDAEGAIVLADGAAPYRTFAQPAPSNRTSGAGDAYTAAFTLALATGAATPDAADLAQMAATAAIGQTGTAVCDAAALVRLAADQDPVTAGALAAVVQAHRKRGRRIVFTNGCFDVLHRGHVGYLAQAKREGDVLIVAVNSDESVRRLKGPDRPVNPLGDRVAVLAALACVDHVVVFSEDSPQLLLEQVRPDVYVKGGDYPPEMIPEAPLVRRLGGEVRVLDYVPDQSTTQLLQRIRSRQARV